MYILLLGDSMKGKIQKWGNSNGIRIPKMILDDLNLKENDSVDISLTSDSIVIRKAKQKTFDEIVGNYRGNYVCEEFEPYNASGKEIW